MSKPRALRAAASFALPFTLLQLAAAPAAAEEAPVEKPAHGFFITQVAGPFPNVLTAIKFAPDDPKKIFALQKNGQVRITTTAGVLLKTPFITLDNVAEDQDQGLVAIAFDPDYRNNRHVYLWYTTGKVNRLVRVTGSAKNPDVADPSTMFTIIESPMPTTIHTGGAMEFGADGLLYLATGNGGDDGSAQDLGNLSGKVLRIDVSKATPKSPYLIPKGNPFKSTPDARKEIFAYGLRNPYTGYMKPGTNTFYINQVGGQGKGAKESVFLVKAGANYGWPKTDGDSNLKGIEPPVYSYVHSDFGKGDSAAITGGVLYEGKEFPKQYQGQYFFIDYQAGWLKAVDLKSKPPKITTILEPNFSRSPVGLIMGPDSSLYYFSCDFKRGFDGNPIFKVSYASNTPPVVSARVNQAFGKLPLTVNFSGKKTYDAENDNLTYEWDFGDGSKPVKQMNATHVYKKKGLFKAVLTVSDGTHTVRSKSVRIRPGELPPTSKILSPAHESGYYGGQSFTFSGEARDGEGNLLPASAMTWKIELRHLDTPEQEGHGHIFQSHEGVASGKFTLPVTGEFDHIQYYNVSLFVRAPNGLEAPMARVQIFPRKKTAKFSSNIPGVGLTFGDSAPRTMPVEVTSILRMTPRISVPATVKHKGRTYVFDRWSDGGAIGHTISVGSLKEYEAIYRRAKGRAN